MLCLGWLGCMVMFIYLCFLIFPFLFYLLISLVLHAVPSATLRAMFLSIVAFFLVEWFIIWPLNAFGLQGNSRSFQDLPMPGDTGTAQPLWTVPTSISLATGGWIARLHTKTCGPDPRVGPGVDATALRGVPWVADVASFIVCPLLPVVPVTPPIGNSATRSVTLTSAKKCAPMSSCHAAHPGEIVRGVTEFFATTFYFTTQSSNRPSNLSYELPDGTSSLLAPNVSARKLCSNQDASGIHDNSSFMKRDVDSCDTATTRPTHRLFSMALSTGEDDFLSLPGEQCWCEMPLLLKLVKVLSPLCVIAGSCNFGLHDPYRHVTGRFLVVVVMLSPSRETVEVISRRGALDFKRNHQVTETATQRVGSNSRHGSSTSLITGQAQAKALPTWPTRRAVVIVTPPVRLWLDDSTSVCCGSRHGNHALVSLSGSRLTLIFYFSVIPLGMSEYARCASHPLRSSR